MADYVFCDFEFNDRQVVLACFLDDEGNETSFDLRGGTSLSADPALAYKRLGGLVVNRGQC